MLDPQENALWPKSIPSSFVQYDKRYSDQDGPQGLLTWPLPTFCYTWQPILSSDYIRSLIPTSCRPLCWQLLVLFIRSNPGVPLQNITPGTHSSQFYGRCQLFLGTAFTWLQHKDSNIFVHLCQSAFTEFTAHWLLFQSANKVPNMTPYSSGFPIDSIPPIDPLDTDISRWRQVYQIIVGCINWLATCTRT